VAIASRADGDVVTCQTGSAPAAVVADLTPRRARFAYSADGVHWGDRWSSPPPSSNPKAEPVEQALYIRLASEDGQVDIVARASSGPPWLYPKPPAKP
jgi:hypothetical protein